MTAKPRGKTGTAKGLPDEVVTALLRRVAKKLGREFRREEAAVVLEQQGLTADEIEGVLQVLKRMPGVQRQGPGVYRLPKNPAAWIKARGWRFTMPRLDTATAVQMLRALEGVPGEELDPALYALTGRLKRALHGIGVGAGDLD